jgi:molecular chaperone GrpE
MQNPMTDEQSQFNDNQNWADLADSINEDSAAQTEGEAPAETDLLAQTQATLAERDNQLLHLTADFENYKRQAARRESEVRERAVRGVLEDLLPVLDNFERAVQAAQNAKDVESLRIGIEFILQQLQESLSGQGVERIEAKGHAFDPLRHEALEEVPGDGAAPGTVVDEAQSGYLYKGQVLRPARVRVAG